MHDVLFEKIELKGNLPPLPDILVRRMTQVVQAIREHHHPDLPDPGQDFLTVAVQLANATANRNEWDHGLPGRKDPLDRKFLVSRGMELEGFQGGWPRPVNPSSRPGKF